jgi:hypothetical protein
LDLFKGFGIPGVFYTIIGSNASTTGDFNIIIEIQVTSHEKTEILSVACSSRKDNIERFFTKLTSGGGTRKKRKRRSKRKRHSYKRRGYK